MDQLLGKFDIISQESVTFRYCGKQFATTTDGITVDVSDNTLKIKPVSSKDDPILMHCNHMS